MPFLHVSYQTGKQLHYEVANGDYCNFITQFQATPVALFTGQITERGISTFLQTSDSSAFLNAMYLLK
jgi:hypothetical protein